jgi:hypothetical protein
MGKTAKNRDNPQVHKKESSQERREKNRFCADLEAHFCIVSGEEGRKSKEIRAGVKNLSESGFCLATNLTMIDDLHVLASSSGTSGNTLQIRIPLPDKHEIELLGIACWYNLADADDSYRYHVGVKILRISKEDLLAMEKFVRVGFAERLKRIGTKLVGRILPRSKF